MVLGKIKKFIFQEYMVLLTDWIVTLKLKENILLCQRVDDG